MADEKLKIELDKTEQQLLISALKKAKYNDIETRDWYREEGKKRDSNDMINESHKLNRQVSEYIMLIDKLSN